jgi:DNA-binding GntR family transcriptional regulator
MNGVYLPGQRMTVREVSERMQTSTMPVREALRRLTSEGILEAQANGATCVPDVSKESLEHITEIRLKLEGLAAYRAATRIDEKGLQALSDLHTQCMAATKASRHEDVTKLNENFHFTLYEAAESPELLEIIANLWTRVGPFIRYYLDKTPLEPYVELPDKHIELLDALRKRDPEQAEAAVQEDIALGIKFLSGLDFTTLAQPE